MNSKERVLAAFRHQEPDRVPVGEYDIDEPIASRIMGREMWVGYGGSHRGLRANRMILEGRMDEYYDREARDWVALVRQLELDFMHIAPRPTSFAKPVLLRENVWRFGDPASDHWSIWQYMPDSDTYGEIDSAMVHGGLELFEKYVEQAEAATPFIDGLEFKEVEWVVEEISDTHFLMADADLYLGLYAVAAPVLLEGFVLRPDLIERCLAARVRNMLPLLDKLAALGIPAVIGGEDWAGVNGPLVSPRHFRKLVLPYLKQMVDACHARGLLYIKHTDGNINPIAQEMLVESGIDGYQAIEPAAGMDIAQLKQQYGHHLTLLGNIDCGELLCHGTPHQVAAETRRTIQAAAPGGGFVLTSSNSIHHGVSLENYMAMLEAARQYGCYPIQ